MNNPKVTSYPNVSSFLADKFVEIGKYQELQKQLAEKEAETTRIVKALGEAVKRRNDAEAMLTRLKFQREENGVWTNIKL
jgi:hypothetical protein